ncbi:transmembrane protein, putative (macronuclear) [Tetrahymena thermophila SB210]|uniref:Transmembrane protein, putative n=1 Tax=Tetrahymena thermophila (strain SB210) TaxID=312017 RepID=W7X8Q8_TETTS|nr:transmembrane protein, putative [Tetrahymena thermophila SB210]EWS73742.1 transmembrane protein, putative [Tetrahymena thermophila SB210]|eukprot:XP_012653706.1 transmembrane protein, putative [Tetrahymena thermophila SB210]
MSFYSYQNIKICIFIAQITLIKAVGCPFWQVGSQNNDHIVQTMILLKSNPQNDVEDIAAVVYNPFTVGIYNFQQNIKYQFTEEADNVQFYQIDKDDRPSLKVSLIHTLDANGRIIGWSSGNGSKGDTLQIPSVVTVDPKACLNSEELIVVTWNSSELFVVDFSSSTILDTNIIQIKLDNTYIIQCVNDKMNRRFLLIDTQGNLFSYDIQSKAFKNLFQISQFSNLQSIYPTQNQIAVTYQDSSGSSYASSYKNNILQFQQSFTSTSTQVLVSQQEDYLVALGQNNLFSVWSIQQKGIVYQADFQNMYCDQRDANATYLNSTIDFIFGSINSKNQIAAVSNNFFQNYIFVYSLDDLKPLLFKNQIISFFWFQAFVVQDKVILSQTYSVSIVDIPSSKFQYVMDRFDTGKSSYDVPTKIQVDSDLNRIIKIELGGNIQYWSLFDNTLDKLFKYTTYNSTFFIDKSLNKLVQYAYYTVTQKPLIYIFDYQLGTLIENIINPIDDSNLQSFVLLQDITNGYMIGFIRPTTQYVIYRFDQSYDHSLIFKGLLIPNGLITDTIYLIESAKQILIEINGNLYLFNYFYSNGSSNQQVLILGNTIQTLSYFLNSQQISLLNVQEQNILIYQHDGSSFNLINTINYYSGQSSSINLVIEQNTLIINRDTKLYFKNYQNLKENILNLNQQSVLYYNYDGPRGLVIAIINNYIVIVIDINTANILYQIQVYANKIQNTNIYIEQDIFTIAYNDGKFILYDYVKNEIISMFDNIYFGDIQYIDQKYNTLVIKSDIQMYTRRLTSTCQIKKLVTQSKLNSFWIDIKSGLSYLLSDKITIYNQLTQQYLPEFPSSVDLTDSYIIYSILEKNFLFVGYANQTSNQVFVYRIDTYEQIGIMTHNVSSCVTINKFFYDENLDRLFVGCVYPGTVVVWDLSKNFQLIRVLDQIGYVDLIENVVFYPQIGVLMVIGWTWWSTSLDYYTLNYRCTLMGIFGDFDYTHQLQILWDHNGDFRIFDLNCNTLAYQHAHQNWIFKTIIDEKNLILTTISQDNYVKTWSYQIYSKPQLMSQIELQNSLYDGILDSDNNYVFVVDFNGFLYTLSYPALTLVQQIQVTNKKIIKIFLDAKHNMLIFGSLDSNTLGYYSLLELIQSNAYNNCFTYEGVMSTLDTEQGIIFHQQNNIVQFWDYESQKLNYGFYVNSQYPVLDSQSKFINIEGSDTLSALLTRDQIIFFDKTNFDIINVQQIKCLRQTQLKNYLICSYVNTLNILDVQKFTVFQQIILNQNQFILDLKQILSLNSIFLTTTQGEVIGYIIQNQSQFTKQFYVQLLNESIVTNLFIEQSTNYIFIASGFNGQTGQFILSKQLNVLSQKSLSFSGIQSHAHVIQFCNEKVFIKKTMDFSLGLYDPITLNLMSQIQSPCIGYPYKLNLNQELDMIIQSCLGVYQINQLSNLNFVAYGRFTMSLNLTQFNYVYTPDSSEIIFVNKEYFLDVHRYQIFIYKINQNNQTINLLGSFQQNSKELGRVANYQIFNTEENIFIQLILYSGDQIAQVQLPIFGQNICQEQMSSEQLSQVIYSIQSVYMQVQNYFLISQLIFDVLIEKETILQPLPIFKFSQYSQVNILSNSVTKDQQKIIINENLFSSFSGYNLISFNNLQMESAISQKECLQFVVQNIQTFELNNIQLGNQTLYTFQISSVKSVSFNELSISQISLNSQIIINLFSFTDVQIILFYFQDDINSSITQISFDNLQIQQSQFNYNKDAQDIAPIFISSYINVTFSTLNIVQNQGVSTPLIKSYIIQNLIVNNTIFQNNKNLMFLSYKGSISIMQNYLQISQLLIQDHILIQNINLNNNKFTNNKQYQALQVTSNSLTVSNLSIIQNDDQTNSNILLQTEIQNQLFIDQLTISKNQGFFNLAVVNVQNIGVIQNSQIISNQAIQSLLIDQSIVLITNLNLSQNQSIGKNPLNSILNIVNSQVQISTSKFKSNQSNQGGSIYLSGSQIDIQESSFNADQSLQQGGSIYSTSSNLNISQSEFLNTQSIQGGSIYFEKGDLQIVQVQSQGCSSALNGGFAYISNAPSFSISNTTLELTQASGDGGSLFIQQSGGNNSFIIYSIFQNNNALGSGGVILLDNSDLLITKSSFVNNTAGIGAVIRYLNKKPSFLIQNPNSQKDSCKTFGYNYCKTNKAIIFGNQIASYPQYASILPSKDFNINITNYPNVAFSNFRSGLSNFDLSIQFLDEFKNSVQQIDLQNQTLTSQISSELLQEISQYNCRIYIQENTTSLQQETIKIEGATLVDYAYHSKNKIGCLMNSLKITGVPSNNSALMLSLGGMKTLNSTNHFINVDNINILIHFRGCQVGEYYNSLCEDCLLYECTQCLNGTYSLIEPKMNEQISCKNCDLSQTTSCQLNQINLRENYWRINNNSDQIFQCDTEVNVCNGDESKGYCFQGYTGALCSACDNYGQIWGEQYGRVSGISQKSVLCEKCSSIKNNAYKQILVLIGILCYLVYLIVESQNSNCKMSQIKIISSLKLLQMGVSQFILQQSVISKIFINQFYIITALKSNIGLSFPDLFDSLFTLPQATSQPILLFLYSVDCSLSEINIGIPLQYIRFIYISFVLPASFLLLIYLVVKIIFLGMSYFSPQNLSYSQTKYDNINMVISTIIVFSYLATQNIYQAALQIIFCEKFDTTFYMKSQMNQECYTSEHNFYIIFLIVPVLILVIVIYPLAMLYILCRNYSKMYDSTSTSIIRRYGYFFQGFKRNTWWWEFAKTWYKTIVLLLSTYFNSEPVIQLISVIFVQSIYCICLMIFKPYQDHKINRLEQNSATYALLIFWVGLFDQLNNNEILKYVFSAILIVLLFMMFGQLAMSFIQAILKRNSYTLMKKKCVVTLLKFMINKFVKNKKWIQNKLFKNNMLVYNLVYNQEYEPFKVFRNWRMLRRIVLKGDLSKIQIEKIQKYLDKTNKSKFSFQETDSSRNIFQKLSPRIHSHTLFTNRSSTKNSNSKRFLLQIDEKKSEYIQDQEIEYTEREKRLLTQDQQITIE